MTLPRAAQKRKRKEEKESKKSKKSKKEKKGKDKKEKKGKDKKEKLSKRDSTPSVRFTATASQVSQFRSGTSTDLESAPRS